MTQKTARKIGFVSALSICFTSVVGIGIFLKNSSVGSNVHGNGASWLITWIIAGLLALLLAYHFGRISRIESKYGLTGLTSWINEIVDNKRNKWFKTITTSNYGIFYNPILSLCLSFFTAEFLIEFFKTINNNIEVPTYAYVFITLGFLVFFILNNHYSIKTSGVISLATSIIKFIPLLMVIFIGMIFLNTHNVSGSTNGFDNNVSFDKAFQGIMLSMPSVLFAFDSFIGVGVWSKNIKGEEKAVSKVIVVAIISVTLIYCLICLSSIFHFNSGGTTVIDVLTDSLPTSASKGISIFVSLTIFISAFGTSNSIIGTSLNEFSNILHHENIIGAKVIKDKFGLKNGSLIMTFLVVLFWSLVIFIPTIIIDNDAIVDGISNVVVVYMFLIYAYLIFMFWWNVYRKDENAKVGTNPKIHTLLVWIALIGTSLVALLNIYWVFYNGIIEPNEKSNWGLFISNTIFTNFDVLIFYISFSVCFFIFPFVNSWLKKTKRIYKNVL